jgi:hypothetical protein
MQNNTIIDCKNNFHSSDEICREYASTSKIIKTCNECQHQVYDCGLTTCDYLIKEDE